MPQTSLACIPGQVPDPGTSSRMAGDTGPGSSSGPDPSGGQARERHGRASLPRSSSPGDAGGRGCRARAHSVLASR